MKHYAGLDVSVKETSVCIVDETGRVCREIKVVSHPDDLLQILQNPAWDFGRIGLEAGPLSQWLFDGLAVAGLPVVCIETRHTKAFLKAQVNKSDCRDAGQPLSTGSREDPHPSKTASPVDRPQAPAGESPRA
jgi:transposase